ncbi:MAG: NAD(P)H-dependent oxidoreductase [Candidimonas sp.]|jgi:NAD(P)H-dependent FMN reductase
MQTEQTTILIIWHSRTGAARQMSQAAEQGMLEAASALDAGRRLRIRRLAADEVRADDLLGADGYVFCAPENLAGLSGAMKECFDRNYYTVLDRLNGRPYALLISAGTDGTGAARQAERICTGWRLRPIAPTYIARTHANTTQAILAEKRLDAPSRERCKEVGGTLAALLL